MLSIQELKEYNRVADEITSKFKADVDYGEEFNIDYFFLLIKNLSPQRYGLRAQDYIAKIMDYKKISSKEDMGDFLTKEGEAVEFKCSFLTSNSNNINIRQIRLWQKLKYYYIFTVNFNNYNDIEYKCYKLTKEEMIKECEILKAGSCHMTKENHEQNEKIELGMQIKIGDEAYKRFEDKYLLKDFDIRKVAKMYQERKQNKIVIDNLKRELEVNEISEILALPDETLDINILKMQLIDGIYSDHSLNSRAKFREYGILAKTF